MQASRNKITLDLRCEVNLIVTSHTLDPSVSTLHAVDIALQKVYDLKRKEAHVPLLENHVISSIKNGPGFNYENLGLLT